MLFILLVALGPNYLRADERRPNIILIVVDDMRHDEYGAGGHPYVSTPNVDRLAREGVTFSNAYHVTPLCSPNRASILTGQFASRHGIIDNASRTYASHRLETFPQQLQRAGYVTAFLGKWHMGNDPAPRPGFDYWLALAGQGTFFDPGMNENGADVRIAGYITDILSDRAVSFISRSNDRPFFLLLAHKALHPQATQRDDGSIVLEQSRSFIPAPRHEGRYEENEYQRSPGYGFTEEERRSKPVLRQALDLKRSPQIAAAFRNVIDDGVSQITIRRRAEMLLAVDEGLGRIFDELTRQGKLDDTVVMLTSDNGYFFGEHGLSVERRLPYEEAVRAPLLVRYPRAAQRGTRVSALAMSIDLAPTLLELARVPTPHAVQGKSLVPVLTGKSSEVHRAIFMEEYSYENPFHWLVNLDYRAVRKGKFKYIRWLRFEDEAELYDLDRDPYEKHNLIREPDMESVIRDMQGELKRLVLESMGLGD
jgi:N-acetylglucosamine-6-sulfatase